jgi:hypothetical protein
MGKKRPAKKGTTEWYMDLVAKTEGFKIEGADNAKKATNLNTGKSLTCHISDFGDAIRQSDITRLKRLGWTMGLFEDQQEAAQVQRKTRARAVTHRLNAFLESQGVFETPDPSPQREDHVSAEPYSFEGETMAVEEIDPVLAQKWLDTIPDRDEEGRRGQRHADVKTIVKYTNFMLNKQFHRLPGAIVFDKEGRLMNGQHTLRAVIASKVIIRLWVGRGFPRHLFLYFDHNRNRGPADTLYIMGENRVTVLAPLLRTIWLLDNVDDQREWKSTNVSDLQHLEALEVYPECRASVPWYNASRLCKLNGQGIVTAHYLITRENPEHTEAIDEWFEQLRLGRMLDTGDPLQALRNWSLNADTRRTTEAMLKIPKQLLHTVQIINCWNAQQEGRKMARLQPQAPATINAVKKYRPPVPEANFVNNPTD